MFYILCELFRNQGSSSRKRSVIWRERQLLSLDFFVPVNRSSPCPLTDALRGSLPTPGKKLLSWKIISEEWSKFTPTHTNMYTAGGFKSEVF